MLDQNTDRMWFVIGAVIVGAAIIFIVNGTIPEIFASVAESFESVSKQGTEVIHSIGDRRYILPDELQTLGSEVIGYDEEENVWTLKLLPNVDLFSSGFRFTPNTIIVPYGESLHGEFWIYLEEEGKISRTDLNAYPVSGAQWRVHDNYDRSTILHNGSKNNYIPLEANKWQRITWEYSNTDPLNVNKVDIYDMTDFGAITSSTEGFTIQIKDISVYVTGQEDEM